MPPTTTREQIIALVEGAVRNGTVSRSEIITALSENGSHSTSSAIAVSMDVTTLSMVQLLQYIGGFIVLLGIGSFIATFWGDITGSARVTIALGGAVLSYALGMILMRLDTKSESGVAFHLIAGVLFPFALYVCLNEMLGLEMTSGVAMSISLALLVLYAATYTAVRHLIFTFFMLAASISFLYSGLFVLMPDMTAEMIAYVTMCIGAAGIFVGSTFRGSLNEPLSEMMYFLGSGALVLSAASLFGSERIWELLYPFLLAGLFYLVLLLRSHRMFIVCTLALMGYIVYLTGKYFADVVGWPVALILTGIVLIAIGYVAVRVRHQL